MPNQEPQEQIVTDEPASHSTRVPLVTFSLGIALLSTFLIADAFIISPPQQQVASAAGARPSELSLDLTARAVYVYDIAHDRVLYAKNEDTQLPIASITKVPLVLAVTEVLNPDEEVAISREAVIEGEGGWIGEGELWKVSDLIEYTLISSSNVGAVALAEEADDRLRIRNPRSAAGEATVDRMNAIAKELGLTQTYFLNASGLDISETQAGAMGSARDVAHLFAHIAKNDTTYFESTAMIQEDLKPLNGDVKEAENTNDAIPYIPGLVFGKTGTTDLAGGNLAIVFDVGPARPIAVVVLGSTPDGRYSDMRTIVDAIQEYIAGTIE